MKCNQLNSASRSIIAVLLAGALVALLSARTHQASQEPAIPAGRMTAQQVLSLSEPICQALAVQPGPLTLTADSSRGLPNFWNVVCLDVAGHDLCNLTWNADTGELFAVGSSWWEDQRRSGSLLSCARAIVLGRLRLRDLQISPAPRQWRLLHPPIRTVQHLWRLDYSANGRHIYIELEAHTGALVFACLLPEESHKRR